METRPASMKPRRLSQPSCQRPTRGTTTAPINMETKHMGKNLERSEATPVTTPLATRVTQMTKNALLRENSRCGSRILPAENKIAPPSAQKASVVRQMSAMERIRMLEEFLERTM